MVAAAASKGCGGGAGRGGGDSRMRSQCDVVNSICGGKSVALSFAQKKIEI
jgi:hypothetical protein